MTILNKKFELGLGTGVKWKMNSLLSNYPTIRRVLENDLKSENWSIIRNSLYPRPILDTFYMWEVRCSQYEPFPSVEGHCNFWMTLIELQLSFHAVSFSVLFFVVLFAVVSDMYTCSCIAISEMTLNETTENGKGQHWYDMKTTNSNAKSHPAFLFSFFAREWRASELFNRSSDITIQLLTQKARHSITVTAR